ncbi:hypothetical protein JRO89_XS03G0175500 [Xanthoceras sorbifolium]|uniref:Uncharacterized protein n=1 Tax=Xanthoceras sorbifolium TaxID=99658 RepID=A0ABQ8IBC2_9ROSI|nr:hypothetical protein JRO89_XS03G0175500 [Xanthoceras sorbifolium]
MQYQTATQLDDEQVYDFLVGLNRNLNEVRGQVVAQAPFPSLEEAFVEVRREEDRRKVMLNDNSALSSALEENIIPTTSGVPTTAIQCAYSPYIV